VVRDAVAFFTAFEGMEQGFRERSELMGKMLTETDTAFVVVAAPRRDAVDEALYFAGRLEASSLRVDAVVVNRVIPRWAPVPTLTATGTLGDLVTNLRQLDDIARREEHYINLLIDQAAGAIALRVPYLEGDVHDLASLAAVGSHLFG
jgi:anion-transporting  ArsA/GET3 family ATPase